MPRAASRILLEITDVRVERLQVIGEEQAQAEGCFFTDYGRKCFHGGRGVRDTSECEYPAAKHDLREGWMWKPITSHEQCLGAPRWAFTNLWNSVNGPDAWGANPWVWGGLIQAGDAMIIPAIAYMAWVIYTGATAMTQRSVPLTSRSGTS